MTKKKDVRNEAMERAVELAAKCESEPGRFSPKVGAVLVSGNRIVADAFRGEEAPGDHAEFTLLAKKLKGRKYDDATLVTTLEPCTVRGASKIPCAERVIQSGIRKVLVGTLDPNPSIRGRGILALEQAGITVELFPGELKLAEKLHAMNQAFEGFFLSKPKIAIPTAEQINRYRDISIDEWYLIINRIYWHRNCDRDPAVIFLHLAELVGGLSGAVTHKQKPGVERLPHLAKSLGWWLALCGRLGVRSVGELLWDKFPGICPYCQQSPHNDPTCRREKSRNPGPDWRKLEELGKERTRPTSLGGWQQMFATIFPPTQMEGADIVFGRLTEELGELAEAVRIAPAVPGYFLSEAADVFAWLMKLQNIHEINLAEDARGRDLSEALCQEYPGMCRYCGERICACASILPGSIGRIAHEVPRHRGSYGDSGRFLTPDVARILFQSGMS